MQLQPTWGLRNSGVASAQLTYLPASESSQLVTRPSQRWVTTSRRDWDANFTGRLGFLFTSVPASSLRSRRNKEIRIHIHYAANKSLGSKIITQAIRQHSRWWSPATRGHFPAGWGREEVRIGLGRGLIIALSFPSRLGITGSTHGENLFPPKNWLRFFFVFFTKKMQLGFFVFN